MIKSSDIELVEKELNRWRNEKINLTNSKSPEIAKLTDALTAMVIEANLLTLETLRKASDQ